MLSRGLDALVLTNAMKPLRKLRAEMLALRERYRDQLTIRVSVDHYDPGIHEQERGRRSWVPTLDGLIWLASNGFGWTSPAGALPGKPRASYAPGSPAVRRSRDRG